MLSIQSFLNDYMLLPGVRASDLVHISGSGDLIISSVLDPASKAKFIDALNMSVPDFSGKCVNSITARVVNNGIKRHPKIKNVIAVGAGKGGVGKSSVAINLARVLKLSDMKVGLLDFDIYGPNIPLMFGQKSPRQSMAQHDLLPRYYGEIPVVSLAQVVANTDPILWRGPMAGKVAEQMFWATDWPELDYLIIDLPPGTSDVHISLSQKLPVTASLLVTTPQSIACMDAAKAASMFSKLNIPILGFVNNMAHYSCQNCGSKQVIFTGSNSQAIAELLQLECLEELPLDHLFAKSNELATELPNYLQIVFFNIAVKISLLLNDFKKDRSLLMPEISIVNQEKK